VIAITLALALAAPANDRWVALPGTAQDEFYVDAYSLPTERGRDGEPWVKLIHKSKRSDGEVSSLWHYAVVCSSRKIATLDHVRAFADGTSARDATIPRVPNYEDVVPDSFGEYLVALVCDEK
jgi:hypothetical protein